MGNLLQEQGNKKNWEMLVGFALNSIVYIVYSSQLIQYCQHSYYSFIFKTVQLRINLDSFR